MVNEYLFLFEKRLRAFTEHFRVTEWLVLYHNQIVAESYCFRHHASKNNRSAKGGKKVFLHEQYPVFFKTVNSVKTELNTTALKLGVDNQPLLAQLFGHINSTDMIGLIGVTNSRGSKEHFATIFFSNKTTNFLLQLISMRFVKQKKKP